MDLWELYLFLCFVHKKNLSNNFACLYLSNIKSETRHTWNNIVTNIAKHNLNTNTVPERNIWWSYIQFCARLYIYIFIRGPWGLPWTIEVEITPFEKMSISKTDELFLVVNFWSNGKYLNLLGFIAELTTFFNRHFWNRLQKWSRGSDAFNYHFWRVCLISIKYFPSHKKLFELIFRIFFLFLSFKLIDLRKVNNFIHYRAWNKSAEFWSHLRRIFTSKIRKIIGRKWKSYWSEYRIFAGKHYLWYLQIDFFYFYYISRLILI